jgi:hypothetical protein
MIKVSVFLTRRPDLDCDVRIVRIGQKEKYRGFPSSKKSEDSINNRTSRCFGDVHSDPCRAQAEIDPDHYDTPSVGAATTNSPSAAKQRPGLVGKDFRGRFALPVDVNYGGVVLARGSYSISIHSLGKQNLVTFTSDRTGVKVQISAQVSAESSAEGPGK